MDDHCNSMDDVYWEYHYRLRDDHLPDSVDVLNLARQFCKYLKATPMPSIMNELNLSRARRFQIPGRKP